MEAIMIAGIAVVAAGGWYSAADLLADRGIRIRKQKGADMKSRELSRSCRIPTQRQIKQMAGVNV
ncbi:MAG TPA: hypothetical protein HPP97_00305 [Desulfuromonadales bacterium]|nr:hypothetical protein [Desulfuromonadales bacterium]